MKRLSELITAFRCDKALAFDPEISLVATDSRRVTEGAVFIAIGGYQTDGHKYIGDAIARGARAIVYQEEASVAQLPAGVLRLRVENSRRAAASMVAAFHDHPSRKLTIAAITGTSGKTTTTLFVDSIHRAAGYTTGVIGTLGARLGDRDLPGDRTTPDSVELQELFAEMVAEDVTHVAMEVSSHALYLDRTWMTAFDGAIFTNLSQDHLDFHKDMSEYLEAKLILFTDYADLARPDKELVGAVNLDDPASATILERARCRCITYGLASEAQMRAIDAASGVDGVSFRLQWPDRSATPVSLRLNGLFNVHNALAAAAYAHGIGLPSEAIVGGLAALSAVPGRFERVNPGDDFAVVVDYAHKPDALDKLIRSARALNPRRVIVLMGCGGDRDKDKRPKMGRIATEGADFTIVTSDNPRTEEPMSIIRDILAGVKADARYSVEPDRQAAIFAGVGMCQPGDMLLICGKGHETYQIFKDRTIHFDDREVAREALLASQP